MRLQPPHDFTARGKHVRLARRPEDFVDRNPLAMHADSRNHRRLVILVVGRQLHDPRRPANGERFRAETLVWTAGVKPSPMLDRTDLPRGPRGHVTCLPTLQVVENEVA